MVDLMRHNEKCDATDYFTALCCMQSVICDEIAYGTLHYIVQCTMQYCIPFYTVYETILQLSTLCDHGAPPCTPGLLQVKTIEKTKNNFKNLSMATDSSQNRWKNTKKPNTL